MWSDTPQDWSDNGDTSGHEVTHMDSETDHTDLWHSAQNLKMTEIKN